MDSKTLQEILDYICNDLGGDWFLTGGALVNLTFDSTRGTEDMDIVRISHQTHSDEVAKNLLFQWLIKRGLGPEWVNSAVEPFVRAIPGWESEVVEIQRGKLGKILRPNLSLFVYLKLRRGSEIDLADIRAAIPSCPEGFSESKFLNWADGAMKNKFAALKGKLGL